MENFNENIEVFVNTFLCLFNVEFQITMASQRIISYLFSSMSPHNYGSVECIKEKTISILANLRLYLINGEKTVI